MGQPVRAVQQPWNAHPRSERVRDHVCAGLLQRLPRLPPADRGPGSDRARAVAGTRCWTRTATGGRTGSQTATSIAAMSIAWSRMPWRRWRSRRRASRLLVWRGQPAGDLGAGVEAELVQNAADVALHGALRYEQAGPDLLVAQALGDQPCDLLFSLAQQPGRPNLRRIDGSGVRITEGQP